MYAWVMEAYRWAERTRKQIAKDGPPARGRRPNYNPPRSLKKADIMARINAVLDGEDPRLLP